MNWKLVFIDDEPLVRNHLRSLLAWEEEGFVLCGEAGDGHQALELIRVQQPDAVIVDMSMPGMDGLELTRYLLETNPLLKIVVLSSYDAFEYVRGSLSYGAVDYVLKHRLSAETLRDVMGKVRRQLEERVVRLRVKEQADTALARSVLRDHLSGVEADLLPLAQYFSASSPAKEKPRWVLMLVQLAHYDMLTARMEEQELTAYLRSVTELCDQAVGGYPVSCTVTLDHGRWVILVSSGDERSEHVIGQWISARGARLQASLQLYMNLASSILVSPVFHPLAYCREAYGLLIRGVGGAWHQPSRSAKHGEVPYVTISHEKRLLAAMEAADSQEAVEIIKEIMGLEEAQQGKPLLLERASAELVQIAAKIARKAGLPTDWMHEELESFQRPGLTNAQTEGAVCAIYTRLALSLQRLNLDSGYSRHVREALRMMASRYRQGITLEETAQELGITASYLSRLVREETGKTFTELLTEQRIERGKQLLLEGDIPLKALHAKLGFGSNSYFIRVFKEATGETPSAYKERLQGRSSS
ncbi:response regulator [Paenibacillus sp. 1P07SE]|uniref:response regulator transcription factor n=1 Tax=Paenibacillus sp. 1P07SE TaxID=3132209 RepID=UPI0039A4C908